METIIVQGALGILLFFILNWIGKHSYSIGYISMSVFARKEDAPAFNFLLSILTPLVYLIITSAILYSLKLDYFVKDFYLVSIYYLTFRLLFNLITGRGLLLNWKQQFLYWVVIIGFSYFIYSKILIQKTNILPDFETLANELWIIIIIFLYQVFNKIDLPSNGTERRKERYLDKMFNNFSNKYGAIIDSKTTKEGYKGLIYAVLILENFNRPKAARIIEYIKFYLTKKPHTLGVMQYHTSEYISDKRSVELGSEKIIQEGEKIVDKYKSEKDEPRGGDYMLKYDLAGIYNTGWKYQSDIIELWNEIMEKYYPNSKNEFEYKTTTNN